MTHYRQVNAVDLNHPRRSCGVDDPIRFDGPNAAPMQLAENLDNIGLSCFGADEPATAPAAAEIVAAKIQDNEPGSLRHRTIETRQHSAGCVPADPGIHDMGIPASRVQHALQNCGPRFGRIDALSLGIAGAKGNDLRCSGTCRSGAENDEQQDQQTFLDCTHGVPFAPDAISRAFTAVRASASLATLRDVIHSRPSSEG